MARKITVLEAHSDTIARRVKKTVAELMIRRLLWERLDEHTVRIRPLCQIPAAARSIRVPRERRPSFIPAILPPLQVPGVRFQQPTTVEWREHGRHCLMH